MDLIQPEMERALRLNQCEVTGGAPSMRRFSLDKLMSRVQAADASNEGALSKSIGKDAMMNAWSENSNCGGKGGPSRSEKRLFFPGFPSLSSFSHRVRITAMIENYLKQSIHALRMARIPYALPLLYILATAASGADYAEVSSIRNHVLERGYARIIHGSLNLNTILVPGSLVGLTDAKKMVEVDVTEHGSPDHVPPYLHLMVVQLASPIETVVDKSNFDKYQDRLKESVVVKTFTDGPTPHDSPKKGSLDGLIDAAFDNGHELDLKKEEVRKHYQAQYDGLVRHLNIFFRASDEKREKSR